MEIVQYTFCSNFIKISNKYEKKILQIRKTLYNVFLTIHMYSSFKTYNFKKNELNFQNKVPINTENNSVGSITWLFSKYTAITKIFKMKSSLFLVVVISAQIVYGVSISLRKL